MFKNNKIKKILATLGISIFSIMYLSGCGSSEPEIPQYTEDELKRVQAYECTINPYHELIRQSRIVSPYAIINSFNTNIEESLKAFDKQKLAIEINIKDIKSGKLVLDQETPINGYYCLFEEGFSDESKRITKTSLVISIAEQDGYLVEYGNPTYLKLINPETGEIKYRDKTPIVSKYFLVGNISKIVGDIEDGDERINIVISNARLVPATTHKELKVPKEKIISGDNVLDTNSGESISQQTFQYNFGKFDFNEDGICDNLLVQVDEFHTSSSFDKIINSRILPKIKTPLNTYVQILYNEDNSTSKAFGLNFPLQLHALTTGECTSFVGEYVDYVKLNVGNGDIKVDSNYKIHMLDVLECFPELKEYPFYLSAKEVYYGIDEEGAGEIVVDLLNGKKESLSNSKDLWLKSTKVMMSGEMTGDMFAYTNFPFPLMYKPSFYFYEDKLVKEQERDSYTFYDLTSFVDDEGYFDKDGKSLKTFKDTKNYSYTSSKNIYVSTTKNILESVEVTSKLGSNVETGIGYYYKTNSDGEREMDKTPIFYTGNQKFALCSLSKDENDETLYWLEIMSDAGKVGYIPVKMNGPWTGEHTIYAYFDNVNDKNYYLFDVGENQGILTKIVN